MNKYCFKILNRLEIAINRLEFQADCSVQQIQVIMRLIVEYLSELKEALAKRGFKNVEEEIQFFKYQKPTVVAKLIYYNAIYKIEARKPYGAKPIRKYLKKELKKIKMFFDNNLDFYKYYRSNNSFLDVKMFLRGSNDIKL